MTASHWNVSRRNLLKAGIFMYPDYYRFPGGGESGFQISTIRLTVQGFYATETSNDDPWAGN